VTVTVTDALLPFAAGSAGFVFSILILIPFFSVVSEGGSFAVSSVSADFDEPYLTTFVNCMKLTGAATFGGFSCLPLMITFTVTSAVVVFFGVVVFDVVVVVVALVVLVVGVVGICPWGTPLTITPPMMGIGATAMGCCGAHGEAAVVTVVVEDGGGWWLKSWITIFAQVGVLPDVALTVLPALASAACTCFLGTLFGW
jgi:hypothetical protein